MANKEQLAILKQGVDVWNKWREDNPKLWPDLNEADLTTGADLTGVDLSRTLLFGANLSQTGLTKADLNGAKLGEANLRDADLREANLRNTNLCKADLYRAKLNEADLRKASLINADITKANLTKADLRGAMLFEAVLERAVLHRAKLSETDFLCANLKYADLTGADLREADLKYADLSEANLRKADLRKANLGGARLFGVDLSKADLTGANLRGAALIDTNLQDAKLSGCTVYGVSVWDPVGVPKDQANLDITRPGTAAVTVDNLEVAQFVYILLNNEKIRDVLDTIGKKGVLILGRFTPERKEVLDALRDKLRKLNFVPMMFDFEGAQTKDFTDTVRILAGMSRFIIADITDPKCSPLELQAIVPDYKVPFVPIIQQGEEPFSMFANLQNYPWMLKLLKYKDSDQLIAVIDKAIIKPAQIKADELNIKKAEDAQTRHAEDYL